MPSRQYFSVPLWRFGAENQANCLQAVAIRLEAVEGYNKNILVYLCGGSERTIKQIVYKSYQIVYKPWWGTTKNMLVYCIMEVS